jgi:hypothetical protein
MKTCANPLQRFDFHQRKRVLVSRWIAMDTFVAIRCSGDVITKPLPRNGRPLWLHYSGFQAVLTEQLPSNGHIRHSINIPKLTQ